MVLVGFLHSAKVLKESFEVPAQSKSYFKIRFLSVEDVIDSVALFASCGFLDSYSAWSQLGVNDTLVCQSSQKPVSINCHSLNFQSLMEFSLPVVQDDAVTLNRFVWMLWPLFVLSEMHNRESGLLAFSLVFCDHDSKFWCFDNDHKYQS